ncbi:MAG: threonine/serine exporter family protein [Clostridia bacterium]|nr:threonine/serine exporter family protein [Clostridia bacterium]
MSIDLFHALAGSLLGTLGFAMLVHAPRRSWLPGALIGMAAFLIYWLLGLAGLPEAAAIFIGSLTGAMAALFCARWLRMISTVFLMMSIVAFVPGLGLYQCMHYLGEGETVQGAQAGIQAMISIAMIVLGQSIGSYLFRTLVKPPHHRQGH